MKSSQLMLGDWLSYKGPFSTFNFKVEQITKKKVGYHAEPSENKMHYLLLQDVQPILLTKELLECNGFVLTTNYEKYEYHEGLLEIWVIFDSTLRCGEKNQHVIHIEKDSRRIPVHYHNTITYLHELQQAMRLCQIEKEIVP